VEILMLALLYYAEFILSPILAGYLLATSSLQTSDKVALFVGGIVAWTLAEYAVHRWMLHDLAPEQHRKHHARPTDAIPQIFWPIWACFLVVYLIAGGAVLAGILMAYAWYLFVHDCAHFRPDLISTALLVHHQGHHKWATRNFGVSTTLWDHVFGTKLGS
jgi:sterol desaturase/sphingolipid hydroxylase (fatty acid hydroxylase superfamily)